MFGIYNNSENKNKSIAKRSKVFNKRFEEKKKSERKRNMRQRCAPNASSGEESEDCQHSDDALPRLSSQLSASSDGSELSSDPNARRK